MKYILILILLLAACAPLNQHLWQYDHAIYVKAEPCPMLYYSVPGVMDSEYYHMETVQARARYLADLIGYEGDDIACSGDGKYLYVGVK